MAIPVAIVGPLVVSMIVGACAVIEPALAVARAVPRKELAAVMIPNALAAAVIATTGSIEMARGRSMPSREGAGRIVMGILLSEVAASRMTICEGAVVSVVGSGTLQASRVTTRSVVRVARCETGLTTIAEIVS